MNPIAVFYHVKLTGGTPAVAPGHPLTIMAQQMESLRTCGLEEAAKEIVIGVNESELSDEARRIIPEKATVILHGNDANTEVPTLHEIQSWLPGKQDWYVCYFHAKGARNADDPLLPAWRGCMQRKVIDGWRQCVADLDSGIESVGCHWLTPEQFGPHVREPFWGGNFWWCKTHILKTLPVIPPRMLPGMDYYMGERWFGWGQRPTIKDYHPTWPGMGCANT